MYSKQGRWFGGNLGAIIIFWSSSEVTKGSFSLASSSKAHIRAEVKDSGSGRHLTSSGPAALRKIFGAC